MAAASSYTYFEEQDEPGLYLVNRRHQKPACTCDIFLIHGLNGGPTKTWSYEYDSSTRRIWFRDFLPEHVVSEVLGCNARIWTFGYNANVVFSASRSAEASDFVRQLLERVRQVRAENEGNKIIWVAHSLGGIVVKMALIESKLDDRYQDILQSTIGTIFLGTPHRGASIAKLGGLAARIARASMVVTTNTNLLKSLERNSSFLFEKASQFSKVSGKLRIYSFYETMETKGILVVDRESACMGLPNEISMPLNSDHRGIARYHDDRAGFAPLKDAIRELVFLTGSRTGLREVPQDYNIPLGYVKCRVKSTDGITIFEQVLSAGVTIEELCTKLIPKPSSDGDWHTGIRRPEDEQQLPWYSETIPATVTSDASSFDKDDPKINEHEPFVMFFSKVKNDRKVEVNIAPFIKNTVGWGDLPRELPEIPCLNIDGCLNISFHRTIRIPDDGAVYPLPPSLGAFPLFNVKDCDDKFPQDAREKGGVFLPMYQREAIWINFHVYGPQPRARGGNMVRYAIRPFVGGVNALSGESMRPNMATLLKRQNGIKRTQDYVVVKGGDWEGKTVGQRWIDGIAVAPGVVRQFVAVPLGSRESVEYQVTGSDGVGGLQLEIIPQYDLGRFTIAMRDCPPLVLPENDRYGQSVEYPHPTAFESPSDFGVPSGIRVHATESNQRPRKRTLRDELDWVGPDSVTSRTLNFTLWPPPTMSYFQIKVGHYGCGERMYPKRTITLSVTRRTRYEFVWIHAAYIFGDPVGKTDLSYPGQFYSYVEAHKVLEDLNITAGSELKYRTKLLGGGGSQTSYSPLMGIGAGGKIRQQIVKDEEDPRIWATEESRIVNVQILNTEAFKSFTGCDPPATPVSFETYVKNGLPFFQTYLEVPATLEYGFKQIMSSRDPLLHGQQEISQVKKRVALPGYCEACFLTVAKVGLSCCPHRLCRDCFNNISELQRKIKSSVKECPVCFWEVSVFSSEIFREIPALVTTMHIDSEVENFESVVPTPTQKKRFLNGIPPRDI